METGNEDESKEYFFEWKIENVSNSWWLTEGEEIMSPAFFTDALMNTKWSLRFYPMGNRVKGSISLYLYREKDFSGPDIIEVNFKLAFLGKDGSILIEKIAVKYQFTKGSGRGFPKFHDLERVFFTERDTFILEDTLTIQCTLHKREETPMTSMHLYGQTVLKVNRKNFVWNICEFTTLETETRYKVKDKLIYLEIVLNKDFNRLDLHLISFDNSIKYMSFNISVIDAEGKKEHCGFKNYFIRDLKHGVLSPVLRSPIKLTGNKTLYLAKDDLSLDFDFVYSIVEYFGCVRNSSGLENNIVKRDRCCAEENKYQNMAVLVNDFKSLYDDGIFSDMELTTSSRTFPVHKNIVSARSPVFRKMFSNGMKENIKGQVDITDIEGDIVYQMLLYIYTGTLYNLQFAIALKLYAAADKYEILSLKEICSSFLKENLCSTNVCDVLIVADLHQDGNLKSVAETYLLEHDEAFSTLEWKNFMDSNLELASDLMYRKVNSGKLCLGNM